MKEKNCTHTELLDRFMNGKALPEEQQNLLAWLCNPANREEIVAYYKQKWEDTEGKKLPAQIQGRLFHEIRKRMEVEERVSKRSISVERKKVHTLRYWLSYAAVALICIGLGVSGHAYMQKERVPAQQEYVVLADNGQRAGVILPDGTKVWLNSHTRLTYDANYGMDKRIVSLTGEAYFEVAKDKEHPFIVKAGSMEVEALGTAFNVKAYEEDNRIITTLFEGKVRAVVGHESVVLLPEQCAVFNKTEYKLSARRPRNASYARLWRKNELAFTGESLESIAALLHRMYNVEVCFRSDKIKKFTFSGVIKNNSLDNVFEIISLTAPITYEAVGDTIYLNEK